MTKTAPHVGASSGERLEPGFETAQTERLTGCTQSQLRYWDRVGLVKPSIQGTGGRSGRRRLYSFQDLVVLRGVIALKDGGLSIQRIRRAWQYLRMHGAFADGPLVIEGLPAVHAAASMTHLSDAVHRGQLIFLESLEDAVASVDDDPTGFSLNRERFLGYVAEARSEGAAVVNF